MVAVVRRYHRWLMLFVGLQFLIWSFSGLYMVLIDIHSIHGEDLLSVKQPVLVYADDTGQHGHESLAQNASQETRRSISIDINQVVLLYPDATNITLGWLGVTPVYRFTDSAQVMLDASTGELIDSISESLALELAIGSLKESAEVRQIELITQNPPSEIAFRPLPLWRIDFVGINSPTLYVSSINGEIVTVRQNTWRIFDLLWRLHIMDYYEGEDINNLLLNIFSVSGFLAALSGLVLLWFRLFKNELKGSTL